MRLLVLSNGHGEDAIAACVAAHLRGWRVCAFPLVGEGEAYRAAAIPVVGVQRVMPSGGFARLGPRQLWADVKAGLLGLLAAQAASLRQQARAVDGVLAVGDIVPLLMGAWCVRRPVAFMATAKSDYIRPHARIEAIMMRRYCRRVYARDELTARSLARHGVPARYCGNVMMDLVNPKGIPLPVGDDETVVALLPGSRDDAYDNLLAMLEAVAVLAREPARDQRAPGVARLSSDGFRRWAFIVAVASALRTEEIGRRAGARGWRLLPGIPENEAKESREGLSDATAAVSGELRCGPLRVWLVRGAFGDVLHRADVCIGLAGTANEQAVGLGKPVVAFPGGGLQYTARFLAAQKRLLGDGLIAVDADPRAVAAAVRRAVEDRELRERVRRTGLERMGGPGAAARIAADLQSLWGGADR